MLGYGFAIRPGIGDKRGWRMKILHIECEFAYASEVGS